MLKINIKSVVSVLFLMISTFVFPNDNCNQPTNIQVQRNVTGDLIISWTPTGNEILWELVIQADGTGEPTEQSNTIQVDNQPSYLFAANQGFLYEVYVRAICTEEEVSSWEGPEKFSDFSPPACAEIEILDLDLNINETGDYVNCSEDNKTIELNANFDSDKFKSTISYDVNSIEYAPPFPFIGGTEMNLQNDDIWSPVINLPFNFCFYGNEFNSAQVGSNGMVTFGTNFTPNVPFSAPWSLSANDRLPTNNLDAKLSNSILGVFQDIDPSITTHGSTPNMNYAVLGTYPCRALVVNFYDVDLYDEYTSPCAPIYDGQSYQIVIYEITNIIEVYVSNRNSCALHNNGLGVIALVNGDLSEATVPPERNTGTWEAQNEAWRFTPSGPSIVNFSWFANGEQISNSPNFSYVIDEDTSFNAVLNFSACGTNDLSLSETFNVLVPKPIKTPKLDDLIICIYEDEEAIANLTVYEDQIYNAQDDTKEYTLSYYVTPEDAETKSNVINSPENYLVETSPQKVYIRIEDNATECYEINELNIISSKVPLIDDPEYNITCENYELPILPDNLYSYEKVISIDSVTGEEIEYLNKPNEGTILPLGKYKIFVNLLSKDGCTAEFVYDEDIIECSVPKGISPNGDGINDALDLELYHPDYVKIYNRYGRLVYNKDQGYVNDWYGQNNSGGTLPNGTYYIEVKTPFNTIVQWIQLQK